MTRGRMASVVKGIMPLMLKAICRFQITASPDGPSISKGICLINLALRPLFDLTRNSYAA